MDRQGGQGGVLWPIKSARRMTDEIYLSMGEGHSEMDLQHFNSS